MHGGMSVCMCFWRILMHNGSIWFLDVTTMNRQSQPTFWYSTPLMWWISPWRNGQQTFRSLQIHYLHDFQTTGASLCSWMLVCRPLVKRRGSFDLVDFGGIHQLRTAQTCYLGQANQKFRFSSVQTLPMSRPNFKHCGLQHDVISLQSPSTRKKGHKKKKGQIMHWYVTISISDSANFTDNVRRFQTKLKTKTSNGGPNQLTVQAGDI